MLQLHQKYCNLLIFEQTDLYTYQKFYLNKGYLPVNQHCQRVMLNMSEDDKSVKNECEYRYEVTTKNPFFLLCNIH